MIIFFDDYKFSTSFGQHFKDIPLFLFVPKNTVNRTKKNNFVLEFSKRCYINLL